MANKKSLDGMNILTDTKESYKKKVAARKADEKAQAKAAKGPRTVTIKVSTIIFAVLVIAAVVLSYQLGSMQSASHNAEVTKEAMSVYSSLKA